MAAAVSAFLKTLAAEPPIKPGTPDPYALAEPGRLQPQEHIQVGPITQYISALVGTNDELPQPQHGLEHALR
jgi:arylsulfatase